LRLSQAGNTLTYTATLANGSPLPAWLSLNSSGRLSGVPGPSVVGTTYQVAVTATDPYGNIAVLTLPITVETDPTQPNGGVFTVAPVAFGGSPAAANWWTSLPAVAVNAAGDAMIVSSMNLGSGGEVIMGQVYNAQHQPVGPVFQVNRTVGGTGTTPLVTADAAGDFDVAWQAGTVAYWQRFSPLGLAVAPAITLAAEQGLEMVGDAAGDLILLWTGADGGIYMRRFDTQGNKLTPTVEVAANGGGYQAVASPTGTVMVVWDANQQAYVRVYNAQLNPLGSAVPLGSPVTGDAVAVAADGLGNFDVAFLLGNTSGNTLEFERFNNLGQPLVNAQGGTGPTVVAMGPVSGLKSSPGVVANRSGNFTIVWSTSIAFTADNFGQRYDPTGRPIGGVFLVPPGAGLPSVAGDPAGDLVVIDLQRPNIGSEVWAGQWYWPTATVQVPAAQPVSLGSTLVFSSANHNAITLTGGNPTQLETLTLTTSSAATLTVANTAGLSSITGNGTATLRLTGTSAVLNAALQGLTFHPVSSALTPTLKLTLAPNATMSVSGSVPITVHANVPPKVTMPAGPLKVVSGSTLVFSTAHGDAITLTDPNAGSTLETLTLYVTNGTLTLGSTSGVTTVAGNGTGDVRVTGTLGALSTALNGLVYTPAKGASGSAVFNVYLVNSANAMGFASATLTIAA
jgi:hypothetical protein